MQAIKVGLLGLGTVGSATVDVLSRNFEEINRRAGRAIHITKALVRSLSKGRDCNCVDVKLTTRADDILLDPDIDIVIELIGGTTTAKDLVIQAINKGKHIVTANKALIAEHGNELFELAADKGVNIAFEAAVAGGIPIIKVVREGLAGNRLKTVHGIVNGTANYILSQMQSERLAFDDALKSAQDLGYAEADPTFDIEGIDAGHKLTILASISFGIPLQFDKIFVEGISGVTLDDIDYADSFGYTIKHLAIASHRDEQSVELRVHPTLIPKNQMLASVQGAMNAVMVEGDAVGPTMFYGQGAGGEPTASAVIADLVEVVRTLTVDPNNRVPHLAFQLDELWDAKVLSSDDYQCAYYLNLNALDKPGTLADITKILGDSDISIRAIMQKGNGMTEGYTPVVMLTQKVTEKNMTKALTQIEALDSVDGAVTRIRMEFE